jgi:2,3-diphosphopglycerate-independent phosphoglycerate mutase
MDPKVLFVMIDGLGDSANECLGGKTYLEAASTPALDQLVKRGLSGIVDPVETGLACGSDTAHMSIFGHNPLKLYQGRGGFETMGAGLSLEDDEIAFKCNFATLNTQTGIVVKRRVSRKFYLWGLPIVDDINGLRVPGFEEYVISVKHATEHRCGLKITGPRLTQKIEGIDPLVDNKPLLKSKAWDESDSDSVLTAQVVNAVSDLLISVLSRHPLNLARLESNKSPANVLLLRGAGVKLKVPKFDTIHNVKSFFIAPTAIIRGLGMTIQSEIVDVPGTTGDVHSNHSAKFEVALQKLSEDYNFGFLHIKAIDDLGHDRNNEDRVTLIEKIDKMIGKTFESLKNVVMVVTGDHSTNTHIGDHSFEPVPFVLCHSQSEIQHPSLTFNEIDCSKGDLGRFPGSQILPTIFKYVNYSKRLNI